jgi:carbonic anhydrase/acetyltransferase-like protein (isoleucine patch superfamily)
VVHCDLVGQGSLLGNNCTILNRVTLGENCLVAANSVVLGGTLVPARSFMTGAPADVKREVTDKQVTQMAHTNEELVKRAKSFKDSGL